jgi:hypothetical protein
MEDIADVYPHAEAVLERAARVQPGSRIDLGV